MFGIVDVVNFFCRVYRGLSPGEIDYPGSIALGRGAVVGFLRGAPVNLPFMPVGSVGSGMGLELLFCGYLSESLSMPYMALMPSCSTIMIISSRWVGNRHFRLSIFTATVSFVAAEPKASCF